jgi:DNA-binding XRE family transcriptional regulator
MAKSKAKYRWTPKKANHLRQRIADLGLTHAEVADVIGVSRDSVNNWVIPGRRIYLSYKGAKAVASFMDGTRNLVTQTDLGLKSLEYRARRWATVSAETSARLMAVQKARGASCAEMARLIGCSEPSWKKWSAGEEFSTYEHHAEYIRGFLEKMESSTPVAKPMPRPKSFTDTTATPAHVIRWDQRRPRTPWLGFIMAAIGGAALVVFILGTAGVI